MQGGGAMKTEKLKKAIELEKGNSASRQVHYFVSIFAYSNKSEWVPVLSKIISALDIL